MYASSVFMYDDDITLYVYSRFEEGCPTKAYKRTRQCRKVLWVMVALRVLIEAERCFSVMEENSTNTSLSTATIIITINRHCGVWDNLCRNSCILVFGFSMPLVNRTLIYLSFSQADVSDVHDLTSTWRKEQWKARIKELRVDISSVDHVLKVR